MPDFTLTGDDFSVDQNNLWAKRVGNDGEIQYLDTTIVAATTSVLSDTAGTPETTDTDATGQQSVDSDAIEGSGGGTVGLLSLMLFGIWLFGLRGNALRRVTI